MDDDPSYVDYKDFKEEYGNDEFLYIVYRTKQGIFDMETLGKTKKLVEDLEKVPYVQEVIGTMGKGQEAIAHSL